MNIAAYDFMSQMSPHMQSLSTSGNNAAGKPLGGKDFNKLMQEAAADAGAVISPFAPNVQILGQNSDQTAGNGMTMQTASVEAMLGQLTTDKASVVQMAVTQTADGTSTDIAALGQLAADKAQTQQTITSTFGQLAADKIQTDAQAQQAVTSTSGQLAADKAQTGAQAQQAVTSMSGQLAEGKAQTDGTQTQQANIAAARTTEDHAGEAAAVYSQAADGITAGSQTDKTTASQTTQTMMWNAENPTENIKNLSELIDKAYKTPSGELEISLEPRELGKIVIKAGFSKGEASILIMCSAEKTVELLARHAGELGGIVQERVGGETTVTVERQAESYTEQDGRGGENAGREREDKSRENQKRGENDNQPSDFLHQLRLGLL